MEFYPAETARTAKALVFSGPIYQLAKHRKKEPVEACSLGPLTGDFCEGPQLTHLSAELALA